MTSRDPYGRDPLGEVLRGALHAEADRVMPSPDALSLIRERTARGGRGLAWTWLTGGWKGPLLASVAALGMATVALSATPAAIDRFTNAGQQSKEREAQQRKTAPLSTNEDGVVVGPDGLPVPSSLLRVMCVPIDPASRRPGPVKTTRTASPQTVPSPGPSPSACPPSTTPSALPVPPQPPPVTITPSTTPQPTQTAAPTPTVVTPTTPPTPTAQPTEVPTAPEEPSPTPTATPTPAALTP
ncbi:hypothetical protein [Actinocorallia longicatena]|uniref:Uncharacterized protein n=1 Tax=Actinocorallia longicatena TaxID=111803 RepID=A0ABP6QJ93_9ACTN